MLELRPPAFVSVVVLGQVFMSLTGNSALVGPCYGKVPAINLLPSTKTRGSFSDHRRSGP